MRKIWVLVCLLCLSLCFLPAYAEDDIGYYLDDCPQAAVYESTWVAENGLWRIEVYAEDGGLKLMIVHKLDGSQEDIWEYGALLNAEEDALVSAPFGLHYRQDTVTYDWTGTYYEDGEATFSFNDEGLLLWNDQKVDAGKGLAFTKIGRFFGGRWMNGDREVIFQDWQDGQYDMPLRQRGQDGEIMQSTVLKGVYDPASDTVTATGAWEGETPMTLLFAYDEENNLTWTENGVSTTLEYSYFTD